MSRHWLFLLLLAGSAAAEEGLTLSAVLAEAESKNPGLAADRAAADRAAARVGPAGAWPDPMLTFGRETPPSGEAMTRQGVEQEVPFPGKLTAERAAMRHEAAQAAARAEDRRWAVRARARGLYHQVYRADRMIALLAENAGVMRSLLRAMEARLASGGMEEGTDVFAMRAEVGRMEAMLFEERKARDVLAVQLNAWLDRPVTGALGAVEAPLPLDPPVSLEEALGLAAARAPLLAAAHAETRHARAMTARARLALLPDFSVMYERTSEGGMSGREVGLGVSVPLWLARPAGERREAAAHAREAEAMARMTRSEVAAMTAMEYHETLMHAGTARRYRDEVLPAAEAAWRLSRRRYAAGGRGMGGERDFTRLIQAARDLIAAQSAYHDALYHAGEHWGELERWMGTELTGGRP